MKRMRRLSELFAVLLALIPCVASLCRAQSAPTGGAIEFDARVTPTAARPEPVRLFTFYLLSKSYAEIAEEAEAADAMPAREKFIEDLKVSSKLKEWMKRHETIDLASTEIEQMLTPDDVVDIPEFQDAYMTANTGGLAPGMPRPKYSEALKTSHPAKYERLRQQYITALKKFVAMNPGTLAGIEAYLDAVNPARGWNQLAAAHRNRMARRAPEIAQTRYLVAKTDTDLNGHGSLLNVPPGMYWLSTLNLNAAAADLRLRWNVEVTVQPGRTTRIELTNLNGTEPSQTAR